MPQGPRSKQISASLALREEESKKKAAADLARKDEVRTTKVTNRRGRQTGTGYEKWDGKKWVKISEAEYDNLKKRKTTPVKETPTSPRGGDVTPPKPAPPPYKARVGKPPSKPNFGPYRYPQDAIEEGQDFIKFDILTYKRGGLVTRDDKNLKGDILGTILLPIPSQIGDNNVANFGPGNMNFMQEQGIQIGKTFIEGDISGGLSKTQNLILGLANNKELIKNYFASEAINAFGSNISLDQILARSQGQVLNPNMELLFSGPGLRQFKFTFKFTPRFEKEATEVKNIIKAFKRNMAPKGSGGDFLSTPNIFQIQYMQGDRQHKFLNKFKLCALTNMSVNYTGDGVYATYYDGTPISMQMDLSFNELTPIYNEDYDDYGSDTGVGY